MNKFTFIFNDHTRIWFFDRRDEGAQRYGMRVGAKNLEIKSNRYDIAVAGEITSEVRYDAIELHLIEPIVKAPGAYTDLLSFFEIGMDIHITHCEIGRPDAYENNTPILILRNCIFLRSWVEDPVALDHHHVHQVVANLQVESWDYEWSKE